MKKLSKLITPFNLFIAINAIGLLMYLVYAVIVGSIASDWLLMENKDLNFCDFSMHLFFVLDPSHLYLRARDYEGCFPPLSYIMYLFFYRIIMNHDDSWPDSIQTVGHMPYFHLVIVYYSLLVIALLFAGIMMHGTKDKKKNIILFFSLLFSVPFMAGAISVANSTLLVMAMLLIAIKLRKSDVPYQKELALILIALCAGFKIYPAVFGILYLLEKRYKEAIRLTIYGIVFFFVPFAFFGGIEGFNLWMGNIINTLGLDGFGRIQSIRGLMFTLLEHFGISGEGHFLLKICPIVFFLVMLILVCTTKSEFRRLFFICAIMVFFPNNAYRYTLCYLAIPLIVYLLEGSEADGKSKALMNIEMFVYSMIFAIPVLFGIATGFKLTFPFYTLTYVELYIYFWAYLLLGFITVHEVVSKIKK